LFITTGIEKHCTPLLKSKKEKITKPVILNNMLRSVCEWFYFVSIWYVSKEASGFKPLATDTVTYLLNL